MWIRISFQALLIIFFCLGFWTSDGHAASDSHANSLKSAYLGASVWEKGLSPQEVNQQLRAHFAAVVAQLEREHATSLLTALRRAEATAIQGWTKAHRKQVLIALAQNRQTQIARLQDYAVRGLFPVNEGQSDRAVPIFVDRRGTHCAVGYLMHVDGQDSAVAEVVASNNLVRVMDATASGLSNWVRMSGLTREEAAFIQPGYPIDSDTTFGQLQSTPMFKANGYSVSDTVVKHFAIDSTMLAAPGDPAQFLWDSRQAMLDAQPANAAPALDSNGVLFGSGQFELRGSLLSNPQPNSLIDWIYFGDSFHGFGGGTDGLTPFVVDEDLQLFLLDYRIRPDSGKFTQFALASNSLNENFLYEPIGQGVLRILAEIYDGTTDELLGSTELSLESDPEFPEAFYSLNQVDSQILDAESLRIRTYGLKAGSANSRVGSIFHEFETVLLGDANQDGAVDFLDISPFISFLSTGDFQAEADCDESGAVDFLDISSFIALLSGS